VSERYVTPSKITAWLDCTHFLALKHQVEDGLREPPTGGMGAFARLLADKGIQHETACLAEYERQGKSILRVSERATREPFGNWVARVGKPFDDGWDVIYQMPLMHQGIRGIADFLVRVVDATGVVTYEPVDAKLARREAKPGHVLQLCFYADAIEASTGRRPLQMHLWLGSGKQETLAVADFGAYWHRLRRQLSAVMDAPVGQTVSSPEPCNHCAFCEFAGVCDAQWRDEDSLIYVAGLRTSERATLQDGGVATLAELSLRRAPVEGLGPERQARLVTQAELQRQARENQDGSPPFLLIQPGEDPTWGHGFEQLPAEDDGDVFLDFEGHPFWRADSGLFFLFGLIELDAAGAWGYRTWWAHTPEEEGAAALALIEYLAARRRAHPGMHVYHYNHTERSSLERLAADHGLGEVALARLVDTGAFVDLLVVARNAIQVGTESYGLKALERLTSYERGHDIDQGAGAVLEYERYLTEGAPDALERIAAYNEDDVRATRALRDWLLEQRPNDLLWRPAELEPEDELPELDEQVARLHAFGPDAVEHLLGDVLGYWRREWSAHLAPLLARCGAGREELFDDPEALAGLAWIGQVERAGKYGKALIPVMRFKVPEQDVSAFKAGDQVIFTTPEGIVGYASIYRLDVDSGEVDLMWSAKTAELDFTPSVVIRNGWVAPRPKPAALSELAARVLDPTGNAPNPVAMALLRRNLPAFLPGGGPVGGLFSDDLDEMLAWATQLDRSYDAIQGPPGTGKTFRGAHLVCALVKAGKRVGITAMSHHAIDNLLEAVVQQFEQAGERQDLQAVKRVSQLPRGGLDGVTYAVTNKAAAKDAFNLVAGTTWLFAGNDMLAAPVDVLLVDEAGQLSLADALAASRSTRNLILLGDPLQLPQVAQACHPGSGGRSVLEHVLGEDATIPAERGVFLTETRRMHPDVCSFISEEIYEGRLTSHPSCARQATEFGTGLRWLPAEHAGRVTESVEEAEIVAAQIERLLGTMWTDQRGKRAPLGVGDVLVVAPYNDQVSLLRARLDAEPRTRGVAVGTVDKFQGRQAAVVFFTMTTSTAADMSHSADFLFSRNRFNVAISRARCLAYLVCTEELLNSRGRDIEEMRLISTICSFVEKAQREACRS
jgi:uncharacterized protein